MNISSDEFKQSVIDNLLIYGTSVVHVDSLGNKSVVNPIGFFAEKLNDTPQS